MSKEPISKLPVAARPAIIQNLVLTAVSILFASCIAETGASQWQGGLSSPTDADIPTENASQWMVLDTGGSGGMRGQGDLRADLKDVSFWHDGKHGAACGSAGAFYSNDGGLTWRRIRQHPQKEYTQEQCIIYYQIELSGPKEIWLAEGKHPYIGRHLWHSTDAGETWEDAAVRFPGKFESVWDLLARGQHVWLLGGWAPQASYRSDDGGKTWSKMVLPKDFEPYKAVTPTSEPVDELNTVYLLGAVKEGRNRWPRLLRSDDGGKNWREIALPEPEKLPWEFSRATIPFATPDSGMIGLQARGLKYVSHGVWEKETGAGAAVLVTSDGGKNWCLRNLPNEELLISSLWMDPEDTAHAFAGVWNGFVSQQGGPRNGTALYETFDGGLNWRASLRGSKQINAIFGLDTRRVWAVGDIPGFAANDLVAILEKSGKDK